MIYVTMYVFTMEQVIQFYVILDYEIFSLKKHFFSLYIQLYRVKHLRGILCNIAHGTLIVRRIILCTLWFLAGNLKKKKYSPSNIFQKWIVLCSLIASFLSHSSKETQAFFLTRQPYIYCIYIININWFVRYVYLFINSLIN